MFSCYKPKIVQKICQNHNLTSSNIPVFPSIGSTLQSPRSPGEDCPYHSQGRHNEPQRNAAGLVTSMVFGGEAYNRVDVGGPEMAEAKKLWWREAQHMEELSDGSKLLLLPLKMIQYDQKEGKLQSFLKSCTLKVIADDVDLAELNKIAGVAERGGGRGIALAMQNRGE